MRQGRRSLRGQILAPLAVLALALVLLAAAAWLAPSEWRGMSLWSFLVAGLGLLAGCMLWWLWRLISDHLRALERLRGAIITVAGDPTSSLPVCAPEGSAGELDALHGVLTDILARSRAEQAMPDRRLAAVVAAVPNGLVVVTESGLVSLVNQAAKVLLGSEAVRVGTSVFAALEREPLLEAIERSRRLGRRVETEFRHIDGRGIVGWVGDLGEHAGALLTFPRHPEVHPPDLEHDLELHETPPPPPALRPELALSELPVLVLDTETTGLDTASDRVISIGAVRLHGGRLYPALSLDCLVNPGIAIPARSTAVHGITDAMVQDAADFTGCYPRVRALLDGTVLAGHNISFDAALLRAECRRAGLEWPDPPLLDTLLLAGALDPELSSLRLEDLADHFAVDVHGRHTALGDCLVTAALFQRLLPRLEERGVRTLGEAQAFAEKRQDIVREQRRSGWHEKA